MLGSFERALCGAMDLPTGFNNFLNVNAKKVIAFGGWDFSTDPTYELKFHYLSSDIGGSL